MVLCKVLAVHIYHHGSGLNQFNLALLHLGSPFLDSVVACLDIMNPPPSLDEGQLGVVSMDGQRPYYGDNTITHLRKTVKMRYCLF